MCSIVREQAIGSTVVNEKANTLSDTLAEIRNVEVDAQSARSVTHS